jgi:hypothetical protein
VGGERRGMSREERRSRRDRSAGQQVSTTTTIHHTTSPPIPPSSLAWEGGCNPSPPLAGLLQPETEPWRLGFSFLTKPAPRLAFHEHATPPPRTRHHATPTHHPALSCIAVSHDAPKAEPWWLGFTFLVQTRSPPRVS